MTTTERRVEHLETTITSLLTIPEAIKGLSTRMDRLETRMDQMETRLNSKIDKLADDVAWIREKLS